MNSFFHSISILTEKLTFGKKKEKRGERVDVGIDPYKGVGGYGKNVVEAISLPRAINDHPYGCLRGCKGKTSRVLALLVFDLGNKGRVCAAAAAN